MASSSSATRHNTARQQSNPTLNQQARRMDLEDDGSPTLSDEERSTESQYILEHQDLLVMYSVNRNESFTQTRRWLRMSLYGIQSNPQDMEWPDAPTPSHGQHDSGSKILRQGGVFSAVRIPLDADARLQEEEDEMDNVKQEPGQSSSLSKRESTNLNSKGKARRLVQESEEDDEDDDDGANSPRESENERQTSQSQTPLKKVKGKSRRNSSGNGTPKSTSTPVRTSARRSFGSGGGSGRRRRAI